MFMVLRYDLQYALGPVVARAGLYSCEVLACEQTRRTLSADLLLGGGGPLAGLAVQIGAAGRGASRR